MLPKKADVQGSVLLFGDLQCKLIPHADAGFQPHECTIWKEDLYELKQRGLPGRVPTRCPMTHHARHALELTAVYLRVLPQL
jgi:hypothetical protein